MSLMIVAGSVVCLEWSNSIVLDLNKYPNQSINNSHEATKAHPFSETKEQRIQIAL